MQTIVAKGFNPEKMLYVPCFLMSAEERQNRELIFDLYQQAIALAKEMGKRQVCYFTTIREDNHPLKPNPYVDAEPWPELPFAFRSMGITFDLTWPTLQVDGTVKSCVNRQELFINDIS